MPIGTSDGETFANEWEHALATTSIRMPLGASTEPTGEFNSQMGTGIPKIKLAGNFPTFIGQPANDNKNLQIDTDPYTQSVIDNQWSSMVRKGNVPTLTIVPPASK